MATSPTTTRQPAKAVKALRVVSKSPMGKFWRAGREFSAKPTTVPLNELKKGEEQALRDEPMLDVTAVEIAEPAGPDTE